MTGSPLAIRLAVAGCGQVFERYHLPAIAQVSEVALVGAAEPSAERRAWVRERLPGLPVAATLDELLASVAADALLVLTPPASHRDLALRAVGAGLHLLVEKPMALTAADATAMHDAAGAAGRRLQIGYARRFREPYRRLRAALALLPARAIASVCFELAVPGASWGAHGGFFGHDRLGGGVLDDVLSHQVDLLGWLLGAWPEAVRLAGGAPAAPGVAVELRWTGGLTAYCVSAHASYRERLDVELQDGNVLRASGTRFVAASREPFGAWRARRAGWNDRAAFAAARLLRRPGVTVESFARQLRDFATAVRGNGEVCGADGRAGVHTVAVIEACRRAAVGGWWAVPA